MDNKATEEAKTTIPKYSKPALYKNGEYRFQNITVLRNGNIISTKGRSTWMTLSKSGFLYLCYDTGRLYFFFDKLNDNRCSNSTITDLGYCAETQRFTFRWKGEYEIDDKYEDVDFKYEVEFEHLKDFENFVSIVGYFIDKN